MIYGKIIKRKEASLQETRNNYVTISWKRNSKFSRSNGWREILDLEKIYLVFLIKNLKALPFIVERLGKIDQH